MSTKQIILGWVWLSRSSGVYEYSSSDTKVDEAIASGDCLSDPFPVTNGCACRIVAQAFNTQQYIASDAEERLSTMRKALRRARMTIHRLSKARRRL